MHKTIKAVRADIEKFQFNTCISRIMEYTNTLTKYLEEGIPRKYIENLILLLAPFAPYIMEELWEKIGNEYSVHKQDYPEYDEEKTTEDTITIGVQVNGKLRGDINIKKDETKEVIEELAKNEPNVKKHIEGKTILKTIVIQNRIVNIVVK